MTARRFGVTAFACAMVLLADAPANAHPVTVDGVADEWLGRDPNASNLGVVARADTGAGELVWLDVDGDARTDIDDPEQVADLLRVAVTADDSSLYFLLESGASPLVDLETPPQLQIAIDLDRTAGSGQPSLAGAADTEVHDAARWEYLLRTQGASITSAEVLDGDFDVVGSGSVAFNDTTIEIGIPWSDLGLAGPPEVARFTIASFREDLATGDVVDIGGSEVSDVIDAVTDYGDPASSGYPSTAEEVMDQVIDYHLDVWFRADGEVYAPLLVTHALPDPSGPDPEGEWVQLRNVTGGSLSLAGFALGDEETVDAGEGMALLPDDTLAAGDSYVVARSASTFADRYGSSPDAEHDGDDEAVPDTMSMTTWAGGVISLANEGDEILVLGPRRTILDVVSYGSGSYPGVVAMAAPGIDEVAVRTPAEQDTDDNDVDFLLVATCASDDDCDGCDTCVARLCEPVDECTPDAGVDAGAMDGGATDAGAVDAGMDAGIADAGMDAGGDAGFDAGPMDAGGMDAAMDAARDAGSLDGASGDDAGPSGDAAADAAATNDAGKRPDAGKGGDAGRPDADRVDGGFVRDDSGGCDCRVEGAGPTGRALPMLAVGLALALRRRRRGR